MPQAPAINDTKQVLWYKIAQNFYELALGAGATGLTPPRFDEDVFSLQKKCVYYSALLPT